jgi:hypothetical protein
VKRFFAGVVTTIALVALVVAGLLLFTDLRVTDQSPSEEASRALLEDGQQVLRCCGKPPSIPVPNVVGITGGAGRKALTSIGLKPHFILGQPGPVGGQVIDAQHPDPGTRASHGARVTLFINGE